nr:phosphoglycerate mutase [Thermomonas flagellata]
MLLPPAARLAASPLPPALAQALARADRTRVAPGGEAQCLRQFRPQPSAWPAAALARLHEAEAPHLAGNVWLRADPAHLRADINGVRLLGVGARLGVDQADVDALLPALRPLFAEAGVTLEAPHPARWYLRLPADTPLPAFSAPEDALGDDVFAHAPRGEAARRWRALESEVQVLLHNHPHNAARVAAGKVAVNALWFWGGGALPSAVVAPAAAVYSDDPVLRGAARLAGVPDHPLQHAPAATDEVLLDLRHMRDWDALRALALPPLAAGAEVVLDFADGQVFRLRRGQRWRLWRRPRPGLPA